jgi:hypothetical protein
MHSLVNEYMSKSNKLEFHKENELWRKLKLNALIAEKKYTYKKIASKKICCVLMSAQTGIRSLS